MLFSRATTCYLNPLILFGCLLLGQRVVLVSALRVPGSPSKSFNTRQPKYGNIDIRDVYSPRITDPSEGTVWIAGLNATIKWDISNPPRNITNRAGEIVLGRFNGTDDNEHLDLVSVFFQENPLADDFDLLSGSVTIEVPDVEPGEDYFIFNVVALLSVFFSILRLVVASPIPESLSARGGLTVYRPKISEQSVGTQWERGQKHTISWDTSSIPKQNENDTGTLLLGFLEKDSENLDFDNPLADDFSLKKGSITFTVPRHLERKKGYIVALLGDSGNISKPFAIV
ncbi:hypothetical protein V5O48_000863 [Marasmius crinis-equi]|uniref:Yeast cell wall synthesis Kre9/Knh1-like N-terminal domain-containing protein n=1 Tax=Marasmius crinis-equi TaxID=585013 RepID=A0ABR3G0D5_9AGAR